MVRHNHYDLWRSSERELKECNFSCAGHCLHAGMQGRGSTAIEVEGSVEEVKITEIEGICNNSATMQEPRLTFPLSMPAREVAIRLLESPQVLL